MSQPVAVLERIEREVSALLVAGLATQRGGRERLGDLAMEASALKLERLAQELRALAQGQDAATLANGAFTVLAMARKLKERLIPWPEIDQTNLVPLGDGSAKLVSLLEPLPSEADVATLVSCIESGNDLARTRAADLLTARGEEAVPELARVAGSAPAAVRREAVRTLGRIGGEAALDALLALPDVSNCWRAIQEAILPYGSKAVPRLVAALEPKPEKKHQERRRIAAALLYRLGAYDALVSATNWEADPLEMAFGFAARARTVTDWERRRGSIGSVRWDSTFFGQALVALARAEMSGTTGELIDTIGDGAVDELRLVGRLAVAGSPLERELAERFLERADGGNAKSRQRAVSFLCGLAYPLLVHSIAARLARNEIELAHAINILGETGGSHATGLLVEMLDRGITTLGTLEQVGDPATVPTLLKLLRRTAGQEGRAAIGLGPGSIEHALASLGDGIADSLGKEMRTHQGTAFASSLERALLQMKGKRAKDALKETDTSSVAALVSRLGHANVSKEAIKALIKKGDEAVESVETVAAEGNYLAANDAVTVLNGIGSARAVQAVQRVLERRLPGLSAAYTKEALLCVEAVNMFARHQGTSATTVLVRVLQVNCEMVQNAAVEALVRIGPEVTPQVVPLLDSGQASTRAHALMVAGRLREAAAEEKALDLLGDGNQHVRNCAATALGQICRVTGNLKVVDALGKSLVGSAFASYPYVVVVALGETGQRAAIPYLRRFADTNPGTSYDVNQAIRKIETISPAGAQGLAGKLKGLFGGR